MKFTERKSISLEKKYIDLLNPIVEKHKNNFSAAIKEVISFSDFMIKKYGSLENAKNADAEGFHVFIEKQRGVIVPLPVLRWLIKNCRGILPRVEVIEESIDPLEFVSLHEDEENIKKMVRDSGWPLEIQVSFSEDGKELTVKLTGLDSIFNEFAAGFGSLFLASKLGLKLSKVKKLDTLIVMTYVGSKTKEEAYEAVYNAFAYNQLVHDEIRRKSEFWKGLVKLFKNSDYNNIVLSRYDFEHLLGRGDVMFGIDNCEKEFGKPISDIPLKGMVDCIRRQSKLSGIFDGIEYEDSEIRIHHHFTNEDAIKKLEEYFNKIFEFSGNKFTTKRAYKMLIFKLKDNKKDGT